jgi:hypothetical protein
MNVTVSTRRLEQKNHTTGNRTYYLTCLKNNRQFTVAVLCRNLKNNYLFLTTGLPQAQTIWFSSTGSLRPQIERCQLVKNNYCVLFFIHLKNRKILNYFICAHSRLMISFKQKDSWNDGVFVICNKPFVSAPTTLKLYNF